MGIFLIFVVGVRCGDHPRSKPFSAEELCGLELDKSDNLDDEERYGRPSSGALGKYAIIHHFLAESNLVNSYIAPTIGQRQRTAISTGDTRCKPA
jgi:hypothetical protein